MPDLEFVRNNVFDALNDEDRSYMIDQCFVSKARETLMAVAVAFDADEPRPDGLAIMREQDGVIELVHGYNLALSQEISRRRQTVGAAIGSRKNGKTFVWTFTGHTAHDACYAAIKLHATNIVRAAGGDIEVALGGGVLRELAPAHGVFDAPHKFDLEGVKDRLKKIACETHWRKLKSLSARLDEVTIGVVIDDGTIYGVQTVPIDQIGPAIYTRHHRLAFELSGKPGLHWPAIVTLPVDDPAGSEVVYDTSVRGLAEIADTILIHKERVIFDDGELFF